MMDPKHVWVCGACGKTNPKGRWALGSGMGWDESCAMNATLCLADSLKLNERGRVSHADPVPEDMEKAQRKAEREAVIAKKDGVE